MNVAWMVSLMGFAGLIVSMVGAVTIVVRALMRRPTKQAWVWAFFALFALSVVAIASTTFDVVTKLSSGGGDDDA